MKKPSKKSLVVITVLALVILAACWLWLGIQKPSGTLLVSELLQNPVYDTGIQIYGQISGKGELPCPCFELVSGGKKVRVYYGEIPGIENGKWIGVSGSLRKASGSGETDEFWASSFSFYDTAPTQTPEGIARP
jgi:hypothetical protein